MKSVLNILKAINFNSIYFNFKYFPFEEAVKFPVFVSRNVLLKEYAVKIQFDTPLQTGMIRLGFGEVGVFDNK